VEVLPLIHQNGHYLNLTLLTAHHNMIKNIIDLLNTSDWYVGDEDIDIAKGKYEAPKSLKQLRTSIKRNNYKVK